MNAFTQAFAKAQPAAAQATAQPAVGASDVLNSIFFNPKARASINYAKARIAIEAAIPQRAKKRAAKLAVVEHLGGQLMHPKAVPPQKTPLPNFVLFADSSKARF